MAIPEHFSSKMNVKPGSIRSWTHVWWIIRADTQIMEFGTLSEYFSKTVAHCWAFADGPLLVLIQMKARARRKS